MSHFNDVCSKYNVFIFDIDGTLVHDEHPIDGVMEAVFKLAHEHDKKIFFYTNGGYCTQYRHWQKVRRIHEEELGEERFAKIDHLLK